ncbi:MAG: right-handed parallel beta-helix repeat-containing protein [Cyclobacteriaceae bacterium]|nr:right-handed parallel beta-helix repeat-containing protein [Cyclobacteriaceae bacterium]
MLYQSVLVDTLCRLTIEKGTRVYAGKDAYLYVKGQLLVNGTTEERVLFRNVRLDAAYENIPGQWGGIVFLEGTHDNRINNGTIRNAIYGIRLGAPDADTIPELVVENTIIENMSHSGILAFTSDLLAENTLIDNCVQFVCANIAGGNYTYRHCTMVNYPTGFIAENPAVYFSDNLLLDDNSSIVDDLQITLFNTIIYGEEEDEILFNLDGGASTTLMVRNNIFRTTLDILDTLGNQLNVDPQFMDVLRYDYRLDTLSPAKDHGSAIGVLTDLEGNIRDPLPDIGAYERIE